MDLRDELAVTRTILANQRTLLTFVTASLALLITGLTLIRFFSGDVLYWIGWVFLPSSVIVLFCGFRNYSIHKRRIEGYYKKP